MLEFGEKTLEVILLETIIAPILLIPRIFMTWSLVFSSLDLIEIDSLKNV